MPNNGFLITGANTGLGKDVARQLALRDDVGSIDSYCAAMHLKLVWAVAT